MKKSIFTHLKLFLLLLPVFFIAIQCTTKEKRYVSGETDSLKPKKKENIVDKAADSYKRSNGYELDK